MSIKLLAVAMLTEVTAAVFMWPSLNHITSHCTPTTQIIYGSQADGSCILQKYIQCTSELNVIVCVDEKGVLSNRADGSGELYGETDPFSGQWHADAGLWKLQQVYFCYRSLKHTHTQLHDHNSMIKVIIK